MHRLRNATRTHSGWRGPRLAASLGLIAFFTTGEARAHIILVSDGGPDTPKDFQVMIDTIGDPQKPTPCGGPGTATNIVTTFQAGQTITVTWVEAVAHSGHFRIAFAPVAPSAATAAVLPDPVITEYTDATKDTASAVAVTATGGSISTSGVVLADNLFPHCIAGDPCEGMAGVPTTGAPKTYSTTVTLPTTPCTNCTLQVVQFMSYHPVDPSFFYHHCAAVTILAAEGGAPGNAPVDASASSAEGGAGSSGGSGSSSAASSASSSSAVSSSANTGGGGASSGNPIGTATNTQNSMSVSTAGASSAAANTISAGGSGASNQGGGGASSGSKGCSAAPGPMSPAPVAILGVLLALFGRRKRSAAS
jgi:uncharacterized protein (TIGR03382 family)